MESDSVVYVAKSKGTYGSLSSRWHGTTSSTRYDWEPAWTRLKQLSEMSEDEFKVEAERWQKEEKEREAQEEEESRKRKALDEEEDSEEDDSDGDESEAKEGSDEEAGGQADN